MKHRLELLHRQSRSTALQDEERQALRESLMSYMDRVPVKDREVVVASGRRITKGMWAAISLLVLILVGGGVAYAAESAMPGHTLYSFKRDINEKVLSFITVTPERKAELDVTLANRRLEEAEYLQDRSELSTEIKTMLMTDLGLQIQGFGQHLQELNKKNNTNTATEISNKLESTFKAHAGVLPLLSIPGDTSTTLLPAIEQN
jgi:hypothetical protein